MKVQAYINCVWYKVNARLVRSFAKSNKCPTIF
jgi:hypothetical protein